jgi:4-hydroxybenzoyl-CoA thioesterase
VFERTKLIRFHHCDPAGIVFYPQYFVLFHELMEDWFNEGLGVNYGHFISVERLGVPLLRTECEFLAPSKIGDTLSLSLSVVRIGNSSLQFAIKASADGELRVRANFTIALMSLDTRRAVPFPAELRARIERFQATESQLNARPSDA